jgi:hypothetical protein
LVKAYAPSPSGATEALVARNPAGVVAYFAAFGGDVEEEVASCARDVPGKRRRGTGTGHKYRQCATPGDIETARTSPSRDGVRPSPTGVF